MNHPIVYLSGISMFLSLITFFYSKGYQRANRFFAGTLFLVALYFLMQYVFIYSNSIHWVAFFSSGFPSLSFLIGPLGYFYVRSIIKDSTRISGWDYLHFLPFILVLIGVIPFIFSSWEHKLKFAELMLSNNWKQIYEMRANRFFTGTQREWLALTQFMFYAVAWWVPLLKHRSLKPSYSHYQWNLIKKWLFFFCTVFSILVAFRIWYGINLLVFNQRSTTLPLINGSNLVAALLFLALNLTLFFFPQILYGLPAYPSPSATSGHFPAVPSEDTTSPATEVNTRGSEAEKPLFSASYQKEIEESIKNWVSDKKFLTSETTLPQLATEIAIPRHHLSYYFNNIHPEKFTDWRNRHKIEYCCQLIQNGPIEKNTMEALAKEVGFLSITTFYRAFKSVTGTTPAEYKRAHTSA